MVRVLNDLDAWSSTKYVSWPESHANPFIRIPLPSGRFLVRSIPRTTDEKETLANCIKTRDRIGVRMWGQSRWNDMLNGPIRTKRVT